jgi:hypothetical protein
MRCKPTPQATSKQEQPTCKTIGHVARTRISKDIPQRADGRQQNHIECLSPPRRRLSRALASDSKRFTPVLALRVSEHMVLKLSR